MVGRVEMAAWYKERENVTYTDGSRVQSGDSIRFHQAPGGLMSHGQWRYGTAVTRLSHHGTEEILLHDPVDGRHYGLFGHVIERSINPIEEDR